MVLLPRRAALPWLGDCRRQPVPAVPSPPLERPAESSAQRSPPAAPLTAMSLPPAPALAPELPLFADEVYHASNRLHRALFVRLATVKQVACLVTRSCDVLPTPVGFFAENRDLQAECADQPPQLMLPGIDHLLAAERHVEAVQALEAALAITPETQPVAAALLQHDLWERFDTVQQALPTPDAMPRA